MPNTLPKTPNSEYSPHKRTRVSIGYQLGLTPRVLAVKEDILPRSVSGIEKQYRVQKSAKSASRSGRPPKLSNRDSRRLSRLIDQDPFISPENLIAEANLTVHPRTIKRHLEKLGIKHRKALRRPKLTEIHAAKQLAFARLHVEKSLSWWKQVIFSDESSIERGCGDHQKYVWCRNVCFFMTFLFHY
jgi:transposase